MPREIAYTFNAKIPSHELAALFIGTSWADGRVSEDIETMLAHTPLHLSAWHEGRLVGFLRAITDTIYRAVLDDLVVQEEFREQGIGSEMMRQMLDRLQHLEEISVDCETNLLPYYEKFGFQRDQYNCVRVWRIKNKE